MGKKSKRRQPKGGAGNTSSFTTSADDDEFLEIAMQQAAAEHAALDEIAIQQRRSLAGLEGFDRFQAVCNNLGVGVIPPPPQQQQQRSSSSSAWSHLSPTQAHLMTQWERSMDQSLRKPNMSASQTMKAMGITPSFVKGLPVGNWFLLVSRMELVGKRVYTPNSPPLHEGDYIEIVPGNDIKWALVGERGTIVDYFEDEDKWGIEMDNDGEFGPSLVFAGNLRRVRRGEGFASQRKWGPRKKV
eukprot:scaffold961_cov83-Skeletonema_dohrnii-CCMP3373.AAC.6